MLKGYRQPENGFRSTQLQMHRYVRTALLPELLLQQMLNALADTKKTPLHFCNGVHNVDISALPGIYATMSVLPVHL